MSPLRFLPLYQTRVWGGRTLETAFHRQLPDDKPYGESWELCDRAETQSIVADGLYQGVTLHELWRTHRAKIFGANHAGNPAPRFPILLKILDCRDVLSVQVHPPAHVATQVGGEPKTEMWFVARADQGALIYAGLRKGVTRTDFEQALIHGGVADLLHPLKPHEGQSLLLPSGRIHALGAGLLVFEIQQNSDSTFRVFDWNRPGLDGRPRDLHISQSMQCINFQDFEPFMQDAAPNGMLPGCPYFIVKRHTVPPHQESKNLVRPDDFSIVALVRGSGTLAGKPVQAGDFHLIPTTGDETKLAAADVEIEWLEITLP